VRQAYEPAAEDEGRLLLAEIAPGVRMAGDEELLTQLISNLIENAFTHARSGGAVTLKVETQGGRAVLSVADRGPGIPEAERREVLRRFYRLDRSRSTAGAGLGLSLVQAIAQLHAGQVELADNAPGLAVRVRSPRRAVTRRRLAG
jgi:signal transduction histidine kinase